MKASTHLISTSLATVALSTLILVGNANAAECKGLAEQSCSSINACRWIEGYTRKDGRSVNSHCKSLPGKRTDKTQASGSGGNRSEG